MSLDIVWIEMRFYIASYQAPSKNRSYIRIVNLITYTSSSNSVEEHPVDPDDPKACRAMPFIRTYFCEQLASTLYL